MTGLVLETPVQTIIWPFLASQLSNAERDAAFDAAFNAYLGTGVTGAIDMAMEEDDLLALERAYLRYGNTLPIRVAAHWIISPLGTEEDRVARVAEAEHHRKRLAPLAPFLRVVGIKCIIDGKQCPLPCAAPKAALTVSSDPPPAGVIDSCTAHMKV